MRRVFIACAPLLAIALTINGVSAAAPEHREGGDPSTARETATTATSNNAASKFRIEGHIGKDYKIGAAPGTTETDCRKAKGTVTSNRDRTKTCTLPAAARVMRPDLGSPVKN